MNFTTYHSLRASLTLACILVLCACLSQPLSKRDLAWLEIARKNSPEEILKRAEAGDIEAQKMQAKSCEAAARYTDAEVWWLKAAAAGDQDAMYALGRLYSMTEPVPVGVDYTDPSYPPPPPPFWVMRSKPKARQWYEKAASLGNTKALIALGILEERPEGRASSSADAQRAAALYQKAAGLGDPEAMYLLGLLYQNGKLGHSPFSGLNYGEAVQWYQKAADLKYPPAYNSLGWMYYYGWGVPANKETARYWFGKGNAFDAPPELVPEKWAGPKLR